MPVISDDRSEPGPSDARPEATKDGEYYMETSFVTFEVDRRLFRVPSYQFFKESPNFSETHKLSSAGDGIPIKLEKVSQAAFRNLLKVLYPLSLSVKLSLSKEEWISVLTLSSECRFLRVRDMAILELERLASLTSLEKVCIGRELSIPSWVINGFIGFVQATTITDDEALKIDSVIMTTAYKLFRIRELRIAKKLPSVRDKVEQIFKEELDRLRSKEKAFISEEMVPTGEEEKMSMVKESEIEVDI